MANTLKAEEANVISGLGTYAHTAAQSAVYKITVFSTIHVNSQLSIVIKNNASTLATSTAPASSQKSVNLQTMVKCAAGDSLSVALTSSANIDNSPGTVKTIITVSRQN